MASILWAEADTPAELNTSWHRVRVPAMIMAEHGHRCAITPITSLFKEKLDVEVQSAIDAADVIVLERLLTSDIHSSILKWREKGKRVYCTFDDNYALMPPSGGIPFSTWKGGKSAHVGTNSDGSVKKGAILNQFREGLRLVNGALVPSKVLVEDYKPFCPNIMFVPNVLHPEMWKDLKKRAPDNQIVLGWGGSSAHSESFAGSGLPQALSEICRRFPRVHISLQTLDPKILISLDKNNLQGRYSARPWVRFEDWPQVVKTFDIFVIPLYGAYDERRSALKVEEAGMAQIPWVASDLAPYKDCVGGILVPNRLTLWVKAISSLIESREERERLAQEGRDWAMSLWNGAGEMYERALNLS